MYGWGSSSWRCALKRNSRKGTVHPRKQGRDRPTVPFPPSPSEHGEGRPVTAKRLRHRALDNWADGAPLGPFAR